MKRYKRTHGMIVCPKCGQRYSVKKMKYHKSKCNGKKQRRNKDE